MPVENPRQDKMIEYSKHMVTLSTGMLGLVILFFEKLVGSCPSTRSPTWLVKASICGLLINLGCFLSSHALLALNYGADGSPKLWRWMGFLLIGGWSSFFLGVFSLGFFGFVNVP